MTRSDGLLHSTVVGDVYPLSAIQRNLIPHLGQREVSGTNIEQVIGDLREEIDAAALEQAWQLAADRHSILRSSIFQDGNGAPTMKVHESVSFRLNQEDWRGVPAGDVIMAWAEWLKADRQKGIDLTEAPLMRLTLVRLADAEYRLIWTFHHVLLDARSFVIVLDDVFAAYSDLHRGRKPAVIDAPPPYREFVDWQNVQDQSASKVFWREKLEGLAGGCKIELPAPATAPSKHQESHREIIVRLPGEMTTFLEQRAKSINVTLNTFVEAAWGLLLNFYSGKDDVVFGAVRSGRSGYPEAAKMVGLFINTIPVRIKIESRLTVSEWLARIREQRLLARSHEQLPLAEIFGCSDLPAGGDLFESAVNFENIAWHQTLRARGGEWRNRDFRVINQPNVPIWLDGFGGRELILKVGYDRARFGDHAMESLARHLEAILTRLIEQFDEPVREISPFSVAERELLLRERNNTAASFPTDRCAHELFEAQARKTPDAVALTDNERQFTYRELDELSADLAARLRSADVRDKIVGVCFDRSPELVIALLAVLKAGAAYAPLDPANPPARLAQIITDARMPLVLTLKKWSEGLAAAGARVLCLDDLDESAGKKNASEIGNSRKPSDIAYVIYTSGTTGSPKGVRITHRSLMNLVVWHQGHYAVSAQDRGTLIANPAFDASVWELWPYLTVGASVHVPDDAMRLSSEKLVSWLQQQRITLAFVPTPLAEHLFEQDWPAKTALRGLLTGGDRLHRSPPKGFPCPVFNHYGPTENTVVTTCALLEPADTAMPSIGRPIANTQVYLLDEHLRPVPDGVTGELYIGGEGLAPGYLNQPELTTEKFIPNPFSDELAARLYKSGDLARYRVDGEIEFIGRRDQQVKLHGNRVEIGEVESALLQHPAAREAAIVLQTGAAHNHLAAFVVNRSQTNVGAEELRSFLKQRLPGYMLPSAFTFLESLPVTANGKVDRRVLAELKPHLPEDKEIHQPTTVTEKVVVEIWCEVLERGRVSVDDNFFELGGNSLAAARVASRVAKALQKDLNLHDIFSSPTVASLAAKIEALETQAAPSAATLKPSETASLSFAQERIWFLEQLSPNTSLHNIPFIFRIEGALDTEALERAFCEIVRRHEAFRTAFCNNSGKPQAIHDTARGFCLQRRDLSALPQLEAEVAAREFSSSEAARPFDLTRAPLLRVHLVKLGADVHWLILVTHHIICDGWSMDVLNRELSALYQAYSSGETVTVRGLAFEYSNFARKQRQSASESAWASDLTFWKEQLADIPAALELPGDRPRPMIQTFCGAAVPIELSATLTQELDAFCRRESATPFMVLLATLQTLLHRYSGQEDILVGSPVAARARVELEEVIGAFVNPVVLRGNLSGNPAFKELLGRTRSTVLNSLAHQQLQFEKLTEALQPDRDLSRSPLFQVMFVLQNEPSRPLALKGLSVTEMEAHNGSAKFDLTLSLQPAGGMLKGYFEYNTDLFDEPMIARMAGHFQKLLEGVLSDANKRLSQLPLLTDSERDNLLSISARTRREFNPVRVEQLFEEHAARTPDQVAVVCGDKELSYRELNERADELSDELSALGAGPDTLVGICVERSVEMMVGLLAILKAGAAYVPLDPSYPAERLAYMLEDSGAKVLLTEERIQAEGKLDLPNLKCVYLDRLRSDRPVKANGKTRERADTDQIAYVIYTSGSTGKPKGVMVTHRNLANFFTGMDEILGATPGVWLAVTSISFDISGLELFWTLTRGFKVVIHCGEERRPALSRSSSKRKPMDFSLFYFGKDGHAGENKYRLLTESAKFADAHDFAAVWTPERHFHPVGGLYPNPSVTSAALAMITRRLQIRAGSVVLPLHQPARVAEEWAVVDNLSNGRAAISFASGWHPNDFALAPDKYARRKEIMLEGIETVRRLWRGDNNELRTHPKPVQPELRAWLTSSGNIETFQIAGELGLNVLTHVFGQGLGDLAKKIEAYRAAREKAGHKPDEGKVSVMLHTFIWEDRTAAWNHVREPLSDFLRIYRQFSRNESGPATSPGGTEVEAGMQALLRRAAEDYFQTSGLFGTPEDALSMVEKLRSVGVDELACLIDFGIETDVVLASLRHLDRVRELANSGMEHASKSAQTIPARSVSEEILRHKVTHLQCTPSLMGALMQSPESAVALKQLKTLLLGGEALPVSVAQEVRRNFSGEFLNLYGPTETTIWSTIHRVEEVGHTVPIGRPIANTEIHILDGNLRLVPEGMIGELFIGGEGVARGYLNQPGLTAEKFVRNPFNPDPTARLFRTSDRVRYRADGTLQFLGRSDLQIKLRGHRVEPGEIEAALRQHSSVHGCVVQAREESPGDARLVAYVIADDDRGALAKELRRFLELKLPSHMIPSRFVWLDRLPLTPNGKINRLALPTPEEVNAQPDTTYVAPRTAMEKRIADLWRELLHVPSVGLNDNFFDLGGHSLLMVQAQGRLREIAGASVPIVRLFQYPTVGALADFLGNGNRTISFTSARDRGRKQRATFVRRAQALVHE